MKFYDTYLRKEIDLSPKMIREVRVEAELDSDMRLYYKTVVEGYGDKAVIYIGDCAGRAFNRRETAERKIEEKGGEENVLLR